ncbi:hypothetical protein GCM10010349_14040 [Streptomyces flavofungini]|nr:hypothetical protein GCM10010349_14040 [Streptomyces flavofungini]
MRTFAMRGLRGVVRRVVRGFVGASGREVGGGPPLAGVVGTVVVLRAGCGWARVPVGRSACGQGRGDAMRPKGWGASRWGAVRGVALWGDGVGSGRGAAGDFGER